MPRWLRVFLMLEPRAGDEPATEEETRLVRLRSERNIGLWAAAPLIALGPFYIVLSLLTLTYVTARGTRMRQTLGDQTSIGTYLQDVAALHLDWSGLAVIFVVLGFSAVAGGPFMRWMIARGPITKRHVRQTSLVSRRRARRGMLGATLLLYVAMLVVALFADSMTAIAMAGFLALTHAPVAAAFAVWGRRGEMFSCGRCSYPVDPDPARWARCPECGNDLKKQWGVRLGQRSLNLTLLIASILAYIVGLSLFIGMMVSDLMQ